MNLNKYSKKIFDFFAETSNYNKVLNLAKKVMANYYSIPIELEDLISLVMYKFYSLEMEETFYYKARHESTEFFIMSRIKYIMFDYCNFYSSKNFVILNNYVDYIDEIQANEREQCDFDYYFFKEHDFDFLTKEEFSIIYDLVVNKKTKKFVAKKNNISVYRLKNIENNIMKKIRKNINR